jgi:hypothetical protein
MSVLEHFLSNTNNSDERNEFIDALFQNSEKSVANIQSNRQANTSLPSSRIIDLLKTYSWDIIDTAFLLSRSSIKYEFDGLIAVVRSFVRTKEWEILVLEKVYDSHTVASFRILLYCIQVDFIEQKLMNSQVLQKCMLKISFYSI